VEDYLNGRIKVDEYISGSFPLQRINEAFEELHAGRAIRSIIEVSK
jgi:S-(hydroxymethyl)glutathione dehydrogenase/alcohol dehydrogenase